LIAIIVYYHYSDEYTRINLKNFLGLFEGETTR